MIVSRSFKLVAIALSLASLCCLSACQLETEPANSLPGEISAFDLLSADNPGLADITGRIRGDNISLDLPAESDVTSLVPTIVYKGSEVSPNSGVAQDFTDPVIYTVSTPEGRKHEYSVNAVKAASSSKDILRFQIDGARGTINGSDITLTMPFGTDLSTLHASVIHNGKSVSPTSGSLQDFTQPVEYTVTAADGSSQSYRVIVSVAPSDAKDISAFAIGDASAEINGTQITLALPYGTDLRALQPSITHTGVSVDPENGGAQDFRGPVKYTVHAANGTTQEYTVLVTITPSSAKEITRFAIGGRPATINGTTISLTMPFGTDLSGLRPTVQYSGKSLSPKSGIEQNFTQPVVYTVSAADGSTTQYTVTLSVAPSTAKDITALEILGTRAEISGTAITLTLPHGTLLTALVPTITHTGAIIQPASGVAQDFGQPVMYTVTAANSSSIVYTVTVTVQKNSARDITGFSILGRMGTIGSNTIMVTVPHGSDLSMLTPTVMIMGMSVDPPSLSTRNFTTPVTYTVTAENLSTKQYVVTVTAEKSSAKQITEFEINGVKVNPSVGATAIMLTLPHGTELHMLTPTITHTGKSINPASGAVHDFSDDVTYRVTAEDNSFVDYRVTVSLTPPKTTKDIETFTIAGGATTFGMDNAISVVMPMGTVLTALAPMLTINGTSVSPANNETKDFTMPVVYTVTAEDGSMKMYTVTVTAP